MIRTGINTERIVREKSKPEVVNFRNPFLKHPAEVGMSYTEHALFALSLAKNTLLATLASLVHAFFPFLFVTYTSKKINQLHELLKNRNSTHK